MAKILVVEDDADFSRRLKDVLAKEQHIVDQAVDGQDGVERLRLNDYELVILDWEMPRLSGIEVLKEYRKRGGQAPVLMLTGKQSSTEIALGLDAGADDYLCKPFKLLELNARVRALLRRKPVVLGSVLKVGGLYVDTAMHKASLDGIEMELLPKELALLEFMMRHVGEVFSPETLLNRIWSSDSQSTVYSVYTFIKTLRKKLAAAGGENLIKNIYGRGYKLEAEEGP